MTTSTAGKGAFAEVGPSKSPSTGIHKPTWKPTQGKPSGKPVEPWKEGVESSHTETKNSAHTDGEIEKSKRQLKGDADPCHDGLSPRCTPPTTKPVEHRSLAGSPTKSPSSGLHKPTWYDPSISLPTSLVKHISDFILYSFSNYQPPTTGNHRPNPTNVVISNLPHKRRPKKRRVLTITKSKRRRPKPSLIVV